MGRVRGVVVALAAVGGLLSTGGCADHSGEPVVTSSPTPHPSGSTGPSSPGAIRPGAGCTSTTVPASTGPAAHLVAVSARTLPAAASGTRLPVTSTLSVLADGPRIILRGERSALLVARDGVVTAEARGGRGDDVPLTVAAGHGYPAQTVPSEIPLVGCDGGDLPPGRYDVVAVVAYGGDPLNAGTAGEPQVFTLVSPAVPLTVS